MEGQTKEAPSDLNVLLLGECGVGKSTFINSFAEYLEHDALEEAVESKVACLIPARFTVTEENFAERTIEIGGEKIGSTSTQGARAYVFPLPGEDPVKGHKVRLIDTPGLGSDRDDANLENVLAYVSQFPELHAVCFLLKPNAPTVSPYVKTCMQHLLSRLDRSVGNNVVFVFTNTRSTYYRPRETLPELKRILAEIKNEPPHVDIPCSKDNMFCTDNEAFEFLVGLENDVSFGGRERKNYAESYRESAAACKQMLSYVAKLKPHDLQQTPSVNEARRSIVDLTKPLVDLVDLIEDNLFVLEKHHKSILEDNLSSVELQRCLYVPCVSLKQTSLPEPAAVCTAVKCAEAYVVAGMKKYTYKKCQKKCFLTNAPKNLIGSPKLENCTVIGNNKQCTKCGCDLRVHTQMLYETELVEDKLEDESTETQIVTKQDTIKAQYKMITKLEERRDEFEAERDVISKAMAKFATFLKGSSVSEYRDAYGDYIDYVIDREKSLGINQDDDLIKRFVELKIRYVLEKKILEDAVGVPSNADNNLITPNDVIKCVQSLYTLKHAGKKIRELHKKQQQVRKTEHNVTMGHYRPEPIVKLLKKKQNNKQKEKTESVQDIINAKIKELKLAGNNGDNSELRDLLSDYFKQQKENKDSNPNINKESGAVPKMPKKLNNAQVQKEKNASGPSNFKKKHNKLENNEQKGNSGHGAFQKQNIPPLMNQQQFPPQFVPPNPNLNQFRPPFYGNFNQYGGQNFPPQGPNFPPNFPPHGPNFPPHNPNFPPNLQFVPPNRPNFAPPHHGPGYNPDHFKNNLHLNQQGPSKQNKQRPKKNPKAPEGKKGTTFKKPQNRKPRNNDDDSDSDRSATDFIRDIGKSSRPQTDKKDELDMMKIFLEEQKKLLKDTKDGKQKGKKVCVTMFTSVE